MKSIGKTLKAILRMKNMPQVEFAKLLKLTPSYISAICNNDDMTCSRLDEICKLLDVNPAIFFDDTPIGHYTLDKISAATQSSPDAFETVRTDVSHLQEIIREKERMIGILERQMDVLNNAIMTLTSEK